LLLEKIAGLDRRRKMPVFKRGSFLKIGQKYLASCEPITNPIDKVAYFVDTYVNHNDHALGYDVLEVLRYNNIEVILPEQHPAPLPAMVYGDAKKARRDLKYNVKHLAQAVRDGCKIICSEPSAALALKQELRHFVKGEDARLVSENTYELMNYLFGLYSQDKLKSPNRKITDEYIYHMPCHLQVVNDGTASIRLLHDLCGVKVTDLKAGCCGLSGTFGMQKKNYELSSQIAAGLKNALEQSLIQTVLTECAACKMQIEHISDKIAIHPLKILAESYAL